MGYPIEIANAMPQRQVVTIRDPLTRAWHWLAGLGQRLRRRRPRTRADFPPMFATGVDHDRAPLRREAARKLDYEALADRL